MLSYISLKMRLSISILIYYNNHNLFPSQSIPITTLPKYQMGHPSHWLTVLSGHWSNLLFSGHYPLMSSLPFQIHHYNHILYEFSTLLFLLIISWRNPNSQLNPVLCLFCTSSRWKLLKAKRKKKKSITRMTGFTFNFWPQTWVESFRQPGSYTISWCIHSPECFTSLSSVLFYPQSHS